MTNTTDASKGGGEPARSIVKCGLKVEFEFQCPKNWDSLQVTDDPDLKYCGVCEKHVYLCHTQNDLRIHSLQKHCIAADILEISQDMDQDKNESPRRLLGYPRVSRDNQEGEVIDQ